LTLSLDSHELQGDEDIDAKRSRPSIGKPAMGHAKKERVLLFGTDQRITSGPAAKRPHSKAEYMSAPERFADSQIPLAARVPAASPPSRTGKEHGGQLARYKMTRYRQFIIPALSEHRPWE